MPLSEPVQLAIVTGVCTAAPIVIGLVINGAISLKNSKKLDVVKAATDGMKDALVAATDKAATEKGKAVGVESERIRAETGVSGVGAKPNKDYKGR